MVNLEFVPATNIIKLFHLDRKATKHESICQPEFPIEARGCSTVLSCLTWLQLIIMAKLASTDRTSLVLYIYY